MKYEMTETHLHSLVSDRSSPLSSAGEIGMRIEAEENCPNMSWLNEVTLRSVSELKSPACFQLVPTYLSFTDLPRDVHDQVRAVYLTGRGALMTGSSFVLLSIPGFVAVYRRASSGCLTPSYRIGKCFAAPRLRTSPIDPVTFRKCSVLGAMARS